MPFNLYKFELTYEGTLTEVEEPKDFPSFNSEIKRDFNFGGVFYKYTSDDLRLGFVGTGRTILETAYQNDGIDANVTLTVSGRADKYSDWTQVYSGRAVYENRELDKNYFFIDFDQVDFLENLTNRQGVKISLDRTTDLDGNAVTPPTAISIPFDSKVIRKQVRFEPSEQATTGSPSLTGSLLFAPYDNAVVNQLETITSFSFGGQYIPSGVATGFSPQFESTDFDNDITIEWDFPLRIKITSTNPGTPSSVNLDYDLYIGHYDTDDNLINTYNVESGTQAVTVNSAFDVQLTLDGTQLITGVSKTDKIRLYYDFTVGGEDALLDLRRDEGYFWKITQDTTTEQSTVKIYTYHEVFRHVISCISGAGFYSDYLGLQEYGYSVDGCAGLNGFTGGYFIRGVDTAPQISFRELLDDVRLRWGLGWTVENQYLADYRVRVEPLEFFFSDQEILTLTDIEDYSETVNTEIINEINLGYKKYATQDLFDATIDDYCTEVQFNLPIQRKKKSLNLTTNIISSPYLIEFTRREGAFEEGWKYDEDAFHIDLIRSDSYTFEPRNTEDFDNISGVISPETTWNIHHHPVYFFLAQALYLNSWTTGKNTDLEQYKNTFFAVNKGFEAEYTGSCNHLETNGLVTTSEDFAISNVYNGLRLFDLDIIRFKTALTTEQLNTIINDHENVGSNNYGYFSFTDPDGNLKQGYLLNLQWNPLDEIGTFEVIKRSDNYNA